MARPESASKTPLGERLRQLRKRFGDPSRDDWAKRLGVGENSVARYERGEMEPSSQVLSSYCELLNANVNWILTGKGEMLIGEDVQFENVTLADIRKYVWNIAETYWEELPRRTPPEQVANQFVEMLDYLISQPDVTDEQVSGVIQFDASRLKRASGQGET